MRWPPNKAWTSSSAIEGHRHFEVSEYGGKGEERWVVLKAVLDNNIQLKLNWTELKTYAKWTIGWVQLNDQE